MGMLTPNRLLSLICEEYNYGVMQSENPIYPGDTQAWFMERKNAKIMNQPCSICGKIMFPRIINNSLIIGFYELGIINGHRIRNQDLSKAPDISKTTKQTLLEESELLYPAIKPTMNYRVAKLVHNPVSLWLRFFTETESTVASICNNCGIMEELCSIWNNLFIQTPNIRQFFRIAKETSSK